MTYEEKASELNEAKLDLSKRVTAEAMENCLRLLRGTGIEMATLTLQNTIMRYAHEENDLPIPEQLETILVENAKPFISWARNFHARIGASQNLLELDAIFTEAFPGKLPFEDPIVSEENNADSEENTPNSEENNSAMQNAPASSEENVNNEQGSGGADN